MCMVVFFRENASIAILTAGRKRFFWAAWTVMNDCRSQFGWQCAQLKESEICRVVERQVWTLTPELPVHVVLVPPLLVPPLLVPPLLVPSLLVPPLLRLQALVPMVQRRPYRVCYFLDCPRKFRLRPLWWLHKSSGFYSCRPPHCPVDASSLVLLQHRRHRSTSGRLSYGYITMKLNKTPFNYCSRHNIQIGINQ